MTREDKQSVISICRILADKMDDSGQIAVQNVISAVERMKEQEQSLYAINRQTAIKTIDSWLSCDDYNEAELEIMRAARSMLLGLPRVTPTVTEFADKCRECGKQRTGHWIKRPHGFKCSKCLIVHSRTSIFCPSCGAKMVEPQESEEQA